MLLGGFKTERHRWRTCIHPQHETKGKKGRNDHCTDMKQTETNGATCLENSLFVKREIEDRIEWNSSFVNSARVGQFSQHKTYRFQMISHILFKCHQSEFRGVIEKKKEKKRGVDKLVDGSTCCHTWTKKLDRTFKGKRRDGNRVCQKRLFILKDVWTQNREKNSCTILEHVIKYGPIVLLWTTVFQS